MGKPVSGTSLSTRHVKGREMSISLYSQVHSR